MPQYIYIYILYVHMCVSSRCDQSLLAQSHSCHLSIMAMRRGPSIVEETVVGDELQISKPMKFKVSAPHPD